MFEEIHVFAQDEIMSLGHETCALHSTESNCKCEAIIFLASYPPGVSFGNNGSKC